MTDDQVIVDAFMLAGELPLTHILTSTFLSPDNRRRSAAAADSALSSGSAAAAAQLVQRNSPS
jgi:hypothetical protein